MEYINKILAWAKANILLAIGILFAVMFVFFPKFLRKLGGPTRRRRRRVRPRYVVRRRRVSARTYYNRPRRKLPRSAGRRRQYTRRGKLKKPWQIKGSIAAKRHMAKIRRMR